RRVTAVGDCRRVRSKLDRVNASPPGCFRRCVRVFSLVACALVCRVCDSALGAVDGQEPPRPEGGCGGCGPSTSRSTMAETNTTSASGWAPAGLVAGLSPLDQVEATLRLLCTGPAPLSVNGRRIGGLPRRRIPMVELASVLAHPSCGQEAKRRVWRLLVTRARSGQSAWVIAAVGAALPGLRRAASRLGNARSRADVEADLIAGFLAALGEVDTRRSGVCGRLVNAAHTYARSELRAHEAAASGEA